MIELLSHDAFCTCLVWVLHLSWSHPSILSNPFVLGKAVRAGDAGRKQILILVY